MRQVLKNEITNRYGKLLVINRAPNVKTTAAWECMCDCGNIIVTTGARLRNGTVKSCGCLIKEILVIRNTKHGNAVRKKSSKEYISWEAMNSRCNSSSNSAYNRYGGRGIKVCERWQTFSNFLQDMGKCPDEYTLDRSDVNGDYDPNNCKWASNLEQANNTRKNIKVIDKDGSQLTLSQLATKYNVPYSYLHYRVKVKQRDPFESINEILQKYNNS